ncbi:MAG: hypothetical protein ACOX6T_13330 [Myxococcales bacterium]
MLRLLALATLLAAPAAAPGDASRAVERLLGRPPEALASLASSVADGEKLKIAPGGRLRVETVRRRLGLAEAMRGSSRALLHEGALETRLGARLLLGFTHAQLADEIAAAPDPEAAVGEAARPWRVQVELTVSRLRWTAAAYLRSCEALSKATGERPGFGEACAALLSKLEGIAPMPAGIGEEAVARIAAARAPELSVCLEEWAGEREVQGPIAAKASLHLDALGGVAEASVSGPEKIGPLYSCLSEMLRLWIFPGVAGAELELPIRLETRLR